MAIRYPFRSKPRQVALDGVIGNPAHRQLPFPVARRQRQLQFPARCYRVVVEELVKIAHAKEQQRIGILPLGRRPLTHEWGRLQRLPACLAHQRLSRS